MAARDVVADDACFFVTDVADGAILNVSVMANPYRLKVAAQDAVEPDARLVAHGDFANQACALADEGGGGYLGAATLKVDEIAHCG